jgi:adenine-specific DNA-methyltransferase
MLAGGLIFCRKTRFGYTIFERTSVELIKPESVWIDSRYNAGTHGSGVLFDLFGSAEVFLYPKSVYAVQDFVSSVTYSEEESLILDFFAGSGTTAHAVINLNREDGGKRKYILVEMANYFYTVLLRRIKKVVFSDKWKDGKAQPDGKGISHFVKYYELEQYEDTLRHTRYLEDGLFTLPSTEDPCRYIFLRDPKMLEALEVNLEKNTVRVDLSKPYPDIDLAETLSNLTGKWIKRIHPDPENPSQPAWVEFADGETVDLKNPDWRRIKPLIWW